LARKKPQPKPAAQPPARNPRADDPHTTAPDTPTGPPPDPDTIESETRDIGRYLFEHVERRAPSVFERRWWDDQLLEWAMDDEAVKVQMFRFVDVLPTLRTHAAVNRHLHEYFEEVREHLPWAARIGLDVTDNVILGKALAVNARSNARRMAKRFIAGGNVGEVLTSVTKLRRSGHAFTLDLLGEAVVSEPEAERYQRQYLDLIEGLAPSVNDWPENVQLDRDEQGAIPRVNVSLKLSALFSRFRPIDPVGTAEGVKQRLRPILRAARKHDAFVNVDMEHYAYKDLTLDIFQQVLMEEEFRTFPDAGIVIQAYLPDAAEDLQKLRDWAEERGTPVWVRLVKGAYWDFETVHARAHGWPIPVYLAKWQSDENFERQTQYLFEHHRWLRPAIASHNLRSLARACAWAKMLGVNPAAWEIQMLYGMGDDMAALFTELGHRVRVYTPFGELIPGMAYLVRRLLENTSNDSFLRQSVATNVPIEELLKSPCDIGRAHVDRLRDERFFEDSFGRDPLGERGASTPVDAERSPTGSRLNEEPSTLDPRLLTDHQITHLHPNLAMPDFQNEPPSDFSQSKVRNAMSAALADVAGQLGKEYPLVIGGRSIETKGEIASRDPSSHDRVLGRVASAGPDDAAAAIDAARRAFKGWSTTDPNFRAEYLELVAGEMRERRFELAAWQVYECGKPWAEADADVAEAIDFCTYYAAEMRRLAVPRQVDVPGEENAYWYRPRGVVVVIAPWNFPLAILTGMTAAALVAGNTVVMKPAEQSSIVAAKLMEIFQDVHLPSGVANFLPGIGEEVGPELVNSPDTSVIAFTGSRPVGLAINEAAADTDARQKSIKKVIAELGGKNAIIVDEDADLDEAVAGVVHSAFAYAGQKCSACSRAIVLADAYDAFLARLLPAVASLKVGPAEDPGTQVGPVIDEAARDRIVETIRKAIADEVELAHATDVSRIAERGYYVGPHVFTNVDPEHPLAQQEIFGPVLAVIKVKNLDEAFAVANGTDYALTGGIFSRSPRNLDRARNEFRVGNLYLNRGCTGALVNRQPFGGYKMSGIGSKAGGPDYLLQFLIPVNVTENTLRRGFAPPPDEER
jgi:RHH-type transcriptional regulator, proline utilization regulon repressor / proline dehydrogenase / delta 1-pyrroline-5-carboxylate dehydrogenase